MNNYNNYHGVVAQGFMSKVYAWMTIGLSITAGVAYAMSPTVNPQLFHALSPYLMIFMLLQMGLVLWATFAWQSFNFVTLAAVFGAYSALMGVTLSPVAYIYTGESIFQVFVIAAAMFGIMAVYGAVTKSDLSSMGNILFMGMIGLIIANLINMFWQNAHFDIMISCIGVGVFALLTAYDVQMLRSFGANAMASQEDMDKVALMGALKLYLDVINIFLYLLRLFGKKRD